MPSTSPALFHPKKKRPSLIWTCFAVPEERAFFHPRTARILITGIGPAHAQRCLQRALAGEKPDLVLSGGFAGGLNPAWATGTVLFSADDAFPWTPHLEEAGAKPGRFLSSTRIICQATEKNALWETTGADAVELESQTIRSLCLDRGIPSATVRAISDGARDDLPFDFNELIRKDGRLHRGKLFLRLLGRPGGLPGLWRLARQSRAAARGLAAILNRVIPGS